MPPASGNLTRTGGLKWPLDLLGAVSWAKCLHHGRLMVPAEPKEGFCLWLLFRSRWSKQVKQLNPDCRNSAPFLDRRISKSYHKGAHKQDRRNLSLETIYYRPTELFIHLKKFN